MFAVLLAKAQGYALMALAVIAVLLGAYAAGGRAARRSEQAKQAARDIAAARAAQKAQERALGDRHAIDHAIRNLPHGGAAERLRESWNRDR